ncbi:MAG: hypothetical protein H6907_13265 [Hyphomicrobiales bacterium]|nr:hypothetical protein [Hyphomicrobiales bacterium]MCP5372695.1 hypothetical protein [Hyphomicrobiales bacterium]
MRGAGRLLAALLAVLSVAACGSPNRAAAPKRVPPGPPPLAEQQRYAEIALSAAPMKERVAAVWRIQNNGLLDRIVRQATEPAVVNPACKQVTDQDLLFSYAMTWSQLGSTCPYTSIDAITDQNRRYRVAMQGSASFVRMYALEHLEDEALLRRISTEHPQKHFRDTAARRLQKVSTDRGVAAVRRSRDQAALAETARHGDIQKVRLAALARIGDQALLAGLAEDGSVDAKVREQATKRLTNQAVLLRIALATDDPTVRLAAVSRLSGQEALFRVARSGPPAGRVDSAARQAATARITGQDRLRLIAGEDTSWQVRAEALRRVTDQRLLARAARDGKHRWERVVATARLNDRSLLGELMYRQEDRGSGRRGIGTQVPVAQLRDALVEAAAGGPVADLHVKWGVVEKSYALHGLFAPGARALGEKVTLTVTDPHGGGRRQVTFVSPLPTTIVISAGQKNKVVSVPLDIDRAKLVYPLAAHLLATVPKDRLAALAGSARSALLRAAAVRVVPAREAVIAAAGDDDHLVRLEVVARIDDQAVLARIARHDLTPAVREAAIGKLTDADLLRRLARDDSQTIRAAALKRLKVVEPAR